MTLILIWLTFVVMFPSSVVDDGFPSFMMDYLLTFAFDVVLSFRCRHPSFISFDISMDLPYDLSHICYRCASNSDYTSYHRVPCTTS